MRQSTTQHEPASDVLDNDALNERFRLFAAVVESTDDAILTKKLDGTITSWNAGAERLYGWTADDAIGRSIDIIVPGERRSELRKILADVRQGRRVERLETLRQHRDGSLVNVSLTISPVRGPSGEVEGASAIARDTRKSLALERQLRSHTHELEQMVAELEQFAYVASHDLQEPLRMISTYIDLISERYANDLDEDGKSYLAHVIDGSVRMHQLINDLLRYSQAGTASSPEPVDLDRCLQAALEVFHVQLQDLGARIDADHLPVVMGNASQLRQVFQNLVSNAVKYHSTQPLRIKVRACQDADYWRVSIIDNGIGVDPAQQARAFQMFQRLQSRKHSDGSGIGLAIVRRIVEAHGGNVGCDTVAGGGAEFWFTLPTNAERWPSGRSTASLSNGRPLTAPTVHADSDEVGNVGGRDARSTT